MARSSKRGRGSYNPPSSGTDINSLVESAKKLGLEDEVNKILGTGKPKLSALQRLSTGLSAFNPAEAILTGKEQGSVLAGVGKYATGIIGGIGSAITGTDYVGERRYFKDVAEEIGIENKILKNGIGFLGDVLLDPTTYFGGAIVRGLTKGVKLAGGIGIKGIGKVAPDVATNLVKTGDSIQDAFGAAFRAGYKTTDGLMEKVFKTMGITNKARAGLAESNLARLGTQILSPEQNKEIFTRLAGGKRLEFALREAGKSAKEAGRVATSKALKGATGVVRETIESQARRVAGFGQAVSGDDFYRSYFPFIKKDKLNTFIRETERGGLRVGSQGYAKQFKNLLTDENLEQDVAKAFFTRETQVVTDKIIGKSLDDIVRDFGKPINAFKNSDEAAQAGYSMLRNKGVFGEELGWISKWDKKFIDDMFSPEFKTIDMLAKATGFDAITSLFKRSVTGLFAPFHIRNFLSGQMQNFEVLGVRALDPRNIASGQKLALAAIGKTTLKKGDELYNLLEPFILRFKWSSFYKNEFDDALRAGASLDEFQKILSGATIKKTIKTAGLSSEAIPFKIARATGNYIEMQQKATAYVTAIGMGKKIPEALKLAEQAGFDYRVLTKFESQILRRIIPFYSFTRKNIELQLRTLGENPQRINQIIRGIESFGEKASEDERTGLPDYLKEGFAIKLPDSASGLKRYLSSLGTPIEQFTGLFKPNAILSTISTMNPILKAPIELGIGKDSFRQRDLKEVYSAKEYALAPQIIKDLLEIKEVEKPIYKKVGDKLVKTGTRKEYIADPNRLLVARSLFTSRGVSYLDTIFNQDVKGFVKLMKLFSGLKPQEIDIEVTKALKDKETKRALEDLLIKMGEYRRYESIYKPKQ